MIYALQSMTWFLAGIGGGMALGEMVRPVVVRFRRDPFE